MGIPIKTKLYRHQLAAWEFVLYIFGCIDNEQNENTGG